MLDGSVWPQKTCTLHNRHFDSTIWNDVLLRGDDIVTATYGEARTTSVQPIVSQLIFGGREGIDVAMMSL